eukprot:GCRY01005047.1.p1 GENE.GCRY01005047.1~~GCRY01005047.1.p1  ORF type:complete len:455 (+),score=99.85 GCRY01005047.1:207-1571(+)
MVQSSAIQKTKKDNLLGLKKMFQENKDAIIGAVQKDLGKKSPFEPSLTEYKFILKALDHHLSCLSKLVGPVKKNTPLMLLPASSEVIHDPKGTVLIISPWNYPVNLAIMPLIGAIAAGCTVLLKVSRHSENTATMLKELVTNYVDSEAVVVEEKGGASMITALLQHKWDHIFFTGSESVGRVVYARAAANLTSVTLELGGRNPVFIDDTMNPTVIARRLCLGKFFNAGQTCIAPNHVYVLSSFRDKLVEAMRAVIAEFYGENPQESESFARIISQRHVQRLQGLIKDPEVTVAVGGEVDVDDKYVAPTVLIDVPPHAKVLQEEVFGPVIPFIAVESMEDALAAVGPESTPLTLYIFSSNRSTQDHILANTKSGGVVVNDCLIHFANHALPFGGVGTSGLGAYHGDNKTFLEFVHERACVRQTSGGALEPSMKYPPYATSGMSASVLNTVIGMSK